MSEHTERETAQLYSGFLFAWRLVADTHDIAMRRRFDDDPVWKRLKEIAAGGTTLVNTPAMHGAILWDQQDAQDILEWHEKLNSGQGQPDGTVS